MMSKKDKKIELRLVDSDIDVNNAKVSGYSLIVGKKVIGNIAEIDGKFAIVENGEVNTFFKTLNQTMEHIIEKYNLNR